MRSEVVESFDFSNCWEFGRAVVVLDIWHCILLAALLYPCVRSPLNGPSRVPGIELSLEGGHIVRAEPLSRVTFGPDGNPYPRNLFEVNGRIQWHEGVQLEVNAVR